jgi:alpha-tubulin suppressor-like RCC1 family protein
MVKKYYGGLISATKAVVNTSSASGIFNPADQMQAKRAGIWPSVIPPPPAYYLWGWGYNGYGQIGIGNTTNYSSPKQVGSDTTWSTIDAGGPNILAVKQNGTMWTWGRNNNANLGLGDTENRSSPTQIGALTTWSKVSAGATHCAAIKTDGTLWTWGGNAYNGQLGLGDTIRRSNPVQVGILTDWLQVSAGGYGSAAIKTDGTLWAWGNNFYGSLGLGDTTPRSSPVQIGARTAWSQVSAGLQMCAAIDTDNYLWTWGFASSTKLGLGDNDQVHKSSPTQVGSETWSKVSTTVLTHNTMAIRTNGTLWGWGANSYGQLGLDDTSTRSSPVQVGALTTWSSVSVGNHNSHGITTTGQLWSWGRNGYGRLGLGESGNSAPQSKSSPVQVGTDTAWLSVAAGRYVTSALKA